MTTVYHHPVNDGPFAFEPMSEGLPLVWDALQLRISAGGQCIPIDGVKQPGTERWHFDLPELPSRLYAAEFYYDEGSGLRRLPIQDPSEEINIYIEGGC